MKPYFSSVALACGLAFSLCACTDTPKAPKQEVKSQQAGERASVLLDRFELHDIHNGNTLSTGLLDKQTGRVWVLRGSKENAMAIFQEVSVIPSPQPAVIHYDAQGNRIPGEIDFTPLPSTKEPKQ